MSKLVNMEIDPKEREARYKESVAVDAPSYPYGLCLHLDDEAMKKLGLPSLPEVGKPVMIAAIANVTSVSENEYTTEGGKAEKRQCVSLQITDLALDAVPAKKDTAESLYK